MAQRRMGGIYSNLVIGKRGTAKYTDVALVESNPHQYGYIDVIQILEGKITLLTEKEILKGGS